MNINCKDATMSTFVNTGTYIFGDPANITLPNSGINQQVVMASSGLAYQGFAVITGGLVAFEDFSANSTSNLSGPVTCYSTHEVRGTLTITSTGSLVVNGPATFAPASKFKVTPAFQNHVAFDYASKSYLRDTDYSFTTSGGTLQLHVRGVLYLGSAPGFQTFVLDISNSTPTIAQSFSTTQFSNGVIYSSMNDTYTVSGLPAGTYTIHFYVTDGDMEVDRNHFSLTINEFPV